MHRVGGSQGRTEQRIVVPTRSAPQPPDKALSLQTVVVVHLPGGKVNLAGLWAERDQHVGADRHEKIVRIVESDSLMRSKSGVAGTRRHHRNITDNQISILGVANLNLVFGHMAARLIIDARRLSAPKLPHDSRGHRMELVVGPHQGSRTSRSQPGSALEGSAQKVWSLGETLLALGDNGRANLVMDGQRRWTARPMHGEKIAQKLHDLRIAQCGPTSNSPIDVMHPRFNPSPTVLGVLDPMGDEVVDGEHDRWRTPPYELALSVVDRQFPTGAVDKLT